MAMPEQFGRVAVLMGGWSSEREVSLVSGQAVLAGLLAGGVDAHGIDVGRDIDQRLRAGTYDRVFNVVHGTGGEDGVLQGVLELLQLPYTGSGVTASALSMDKMLTKRIWRSAGLPTPNFMRLNADSDWDAVAKALGLPVVVKPSAEGSSIGVAIVERAGDLPQAYANAALTGGLVMAEQFIEGEELTCGILDGEALPLIRVAASQRFYDYHAKYVADDTEYRCPAGLDDAVEAAIRQLSLQAFEVLGAAGWGRVDCFRDRAGKVWLIELNTVPGMTSHSLVPKAAAVAGIDFNTLVRRILATSLCRDRRLP
ncbi:MAG: D-alanine--D-alanine ligase [Thiotrichales bacterium]